MMESPEKIRAEWIGNHLLYISVKAPCGYSIFIQEPLSIYPNIEEAKEALLMDFKKHISKCSGKHSRFGVIRKENKT